MNILREMIQRRRFIKLPNTCLCIALIAVVTLFVGGCRDYGNNRGDLAKLQKICDPVREVPAAFEAHKHAHGDYPLNVAGLDMTLPRSSAAVAALNSVEGFIYSSSGDSFSIYRKLNWDGGVVFSSSRPEWLYTLNEDKQISVYTP